MTALAVGRDCGEIDSTGLDRLLIFNLKPNICAPDISGTGHGVLELSIAVLRFTN